MIEFNCHHCGKALHLNDSYAGRDGWCRVCKRMVIVPDGKGPPARIEDFPPQEGYARLQRLLQYAASKADQYKIHLNRQAHDENKRVKLEALVEQLRGGLVETERRARHYRDERDRAQRSLVNAHARISRLEEAIRSGEARGPAGQVQKLEAALAAERAALESLHDQFRSLEKSYAALEVELARHRAEKQAAPADDARVGRLEAELAALTGERDRLARARDETSRAEAELAGRIQEQEAEMIAIRTELSSGRNELAGLKSRLQDAEADRISLQADLDHHRKMHEDVRRAAALDAERRRELEQQVAGLESQVKQVGQERDRIARALEEEIPDAENMSRMLLEKDKAIDALQARLSGARAEQEQANQSTRAQIAALEEQVSLVDEVKGRLAALQLKLKGMEQERLDASLALEDARHAEVLAQKKISALETSLREASDDRAGRAVQVEQLQRALAGREEDARSLAAELESATAAQTEAVLAREKDGRAARLAENRAEKLSAELAELRDAHDSATLDAEAAGRQVATLESELRALRDGYDQIRREAAADKASASQSAAERDTAVQSLQEMRARSAAERDNLAGTLAAREEALATLRAGVEQTQGIAETEKAARERYIVELQAEVMNLNEALERAHASANAGDHGRAEELAARDADAARLEAALAEANARGARLEGQLDQQRESAALHQVEEEKLARMLERARNENEALTAALADAASFGSLPDSPEGDGGGTDDSDVIILKASAPATAGGDPESPAERQRVQEQQDMMDALSDFLNK